MNLIKATIATAAITVCCLGNDYPARAQMTAGTRVTFQAGQNYGYVLGVVATSCSLYGLGKISYSNFRTAVEIANELDETTPSIRRTVLRKITDNSEGKFAKCVPVVRSVMDAWPYTDNRGVL